MDPALARRLHRVVEPCHSLVYFSPEQRTAYAGAGITDYAMGYFASRAAALGAVGPEPVRAMFYGFAPRLVAGALPAAWEYASPQRMLDARLEVADGALRRMLGDAVHGDGVAEAAEIAVAAAQACETAGRPLAAAHQALPVPDAPHLALWHAATVLREHRGDGHVAALVDHELGPRSSLLTYAAVRPSYTGFVRTMRGWTAEELDEAGQELVERGLVDDDGAATDAGRRLRDSVEAATDRLALGPWQAIGAERAERLVDALTPLVDAIKAAQAA